MNVTLILGGDPTRGARIEIIDRWFSVNFKELLQSFGISKSLEEQLNPKATINSLEDIPCAFCSRPAMFASAELTECLTRTHINHSLILCDIKRETFLLCDGCAEIVKEIIERYDEYRKNEEHIGSLKCANASMLREFGRKIYNERLKLKRPFSLVVASQ